MNNRSDEIVRGAGHPLKQAVKSRVSGRVVFDEPMAAHTWLRVGGPADVYVWPRDADDLVSLVRWLTAEAVPYFVIGGGSNLLVRDKGIRGVVIDISAGMKGLSLEPEISGTSVVRAMAGENLSRLCRFAIEKGLGGMQFAIGIPGSVGGAILMNAGAGGAAVENVLVGVRVLFPDGRVTEFEKSRLAFRYRGMTVPGVHDPLHPPVIVEGFFKLYPACRDELKKEAETLLKQRGRRQPSGVASAGCFFKNPENAEPAGMLIEKAGMKGMQIGDAMVSESHANFIVNRGRATAADILRLMEKVREAVYQQFRIDLESEVRIAGE